MKYLTFVDNINTFNLKNHQVLKLKFPSIKHWQWIFSRGVPFRTPTGSDRIKCTDGAISAELLPFYMPCVARGISSSH